MRPVEVWIVSFDLRKAFRRLAEVQRARFDNRNVCLLLENVLTVSFDYRKDSFEVGSDLDSLI